ncbi:PREDICTED: uncharacterized protein LOC109129155 [Camelina sativa]|uniref:Uncharacterized protein LOC109129155 n=1 Tax=Camelina sativa TaxID=90675 RepID=A0ABM1R014_CAMSA|nr:PREDICTED: uncharacterized protein LOC109129155 [Camelina sativa]
MGDHESSVTPGSTGVIVGQSDVKTAIPPYTLSSSDNPGVMITSVLLTEDNYIQCWIRSSIESKLNSTMTFVSSEQELWEELQYRFSIGNKVRVHQIKAKLASCRQDGQSVMEYYGRLCNLWEELKNYRVSPVCSCGVTLSAIVEERDEEKLHQFVMGLDDSRFGGLCTTLISMDPLPSLAVAYSKVIREEQRMSSASLQQNHEFVGFLARSDNRDQSSCGDASLFRTDHTGSLLGKGRSCTHCGRTGHEQKDCWQLVGFPYWWMDRERGTSGGRGSPGRGRGGRGSMVSSGGRGRGKPMTAHATSSNSSIFLALTSEQLKVLTQMIHEKSGNDSSDKLSGKLEFGDIILDTGASHHMTGRLSLLHNVVSIPTCSVGFADGSKTFAMSVGVLSLTDKVSLTNDRFSRTLIGSGEERDGVYYLTDVASTKIHAATSFSSVGSDSCGVCFRAKQTREVFPEIYFLTIVDDYSRAVWTYLLLEKSEVRNVLTNFITYAEKQFSKVVKTVRSDNGTKFMCLSSYFREKGIAKFPINFWGESVLTAAYLINRTPSSIHKGCTPYELLYGYSLSISSSVQPLDDDWLVAPLPSTDAHVADRGSSSVSEVVINRGIPSVSETVPPTSVSPVSDSSVLDRQPNPSSSDNSGSVVVPLSVSVSAFDSSLSMQSLPPPRKSSRQPTPSVRLQDYVLYNVDSTLVVSHALSAASTQSSSSGYLASIVSNVEPKHFKEAVRLKVWNNAMTKEVDALEIHRTWDVVDLPPNKVAIGCQWVYKTKYNADGLVERYKARLVALGNNQVEAANQWEVYQMDVNNAFLHGDLDEEVYMKLPTGFRHTHPGKVCHLRKSLYGLKQALRSWFKKLSDSLLRFGFVQSYDDYSLFSYSRGGIELHVLVYVDDLVICGNDAYMLRQFKDYLSRCFSMKDLGKLKYFLGIEMSRASDGIFISQRNYALDIVSDYDLADSRFAFTPLEKNHGLAKDDGPLPLDPKRYRRLVGRLLYLLHTRLELCYSVHVLSQFMKTPREAHWDAALRVVRFLKGVPAHGILLNADKDLTLTVYCDSDWSSCPLTRRSLSAYVVFMGSSPISWKTKKQDTVSHSSAETEYRSMAVALKEIKWLRKLLKGLGVELTFPARLFCDSKAAIHIATNPVFHERTKHIENDLSCGAEFLS